MSTCVYVHMRMYVCSHWNIWDIIIIIVNYYTIIIIDFIHIQ